MGAKPVTQAEQDWIKKVQAVVNESPSKRLEAYTTGGFDISLFDASFEGQIDFPFTIEHG